MKPNNSSPEVQHFRSPTLHIWKEFANTRNNQYSLKLTLQACVFPLERQIFKLKSPSLSLFLALLYEFNFSIPFLPLESCMFLWTHIWKDEKIDTALFQELQTELLASRIPSRPCPEMPLWGKKRNWSLGECFIFLNLFAQQLFSLRQMTKHYLWDRKIHTLQRSSQNHCNPIVSHRMHSVHHSLYHIFCANGQIHWFPVLNHLNF